MSGVGSYVNHITAYVWRTAFKGVNLIAGKNRCGVRRYTLIRVSLCLPAD